MNKEQHDDFTKLCDFYDQYPSKHLSKIYFRKKIRLGMIKSRTEVLSEVLSEVELKIIDNLDKEINAIIHLLNTRTKD